MVLAKILLRDERKLLYQGRLFGAAARKLVASLQLLFNFSSLYSSQVDEKSSHWNLKSSSVSGVGGLSDKPDSDELLILLFTEGGRG